MSEDMTNVVDDDAEIPANNATDPTATATPADAVSTPADDEVPATAEAFAEVTPADEATEDGAVNEASAEPVADATPAEVVAEWSPTQDNADADTDAGVPEAAASESAPESSAPSDDVVTDAPSDDAGATGDGMEAFSETAGATDDVVTEVTPEAYGTTDAAPAEGTVEGSDAATEGVAGQERPRRRDRDGKRGGGGGANRNANKRKLDTIEVGEEMQGVVRSLQTYGAFVDVGAERDGLVHISELRDGFVEKVEDVVKEGDTVSVRVKEVDVSKGRLSLTMRPPRPVREERAPREPRAAGEGAPVGTEGGERPRRERNFGPGERREGSGERREGGERRERTEGARPPREGDDNRIKLRDLVEGATLTGKVTSLVDYGAFVDIGAATDGLVHISEIQDERVNKVSDVLSEGQEVQVRILSVDKKRNRVSLSMKPAGEAVDTSYQYEEEDAGFEPASPMKDAFDRAREKKRRDKRGGEKGRKNRYDDDVDDIISRTLRWRD